MTEPRGPLEGHPASHGPKGHPLLGSLRDFNRDPLGFYARGAREYGDIVPVRLGPNPGLRIYHPDAIEKVLVARSREFIKTRGVRLLRALLGDGGKTLRTNGTKARSRPSPYRAADA
jgi:hypothetical protein